MGLARSGSAERPSVSSRHEEEAMSRHIVDDEQRRIVLGLRTQFRNPHTPFGFRRRGGICGVGAPRRCTPTSPVSRRLAYAPAALGTRYLLILGQAPDTTDVIFKKHSQDYNVDL
jgi:hypothetical protein